MRFVFLILLLALAVAAAPPKKTTPAKATVSKPTKSTTTRFTPTTKTPKSTKSLKTTTSAITTTSPQPIANTTTTTEEEFHTTTPEWFEHDNETTEPKIDYCYDSTYSFKCRQTNPAEYELECRIANADGTPCFPDLVEMLESASPLTTIGYPVHTFEAREAANTLIEHTPTMITAENIETLSLHAPFERLPENAFARLHRLKKIVMESLDGVERVEIHEHAFTNTTAKHLHLAGLQASHVLNRKFDLHRFDTITLSDTKFFCHQQENKTCEHLFENMKSVETLNLESIHVRGGKMDERLFRPIEDSLKKLTMDVVFDRGDKKFFKDELKTTKEDDEDKNCTRTKKPLLHHGRFPVETFAFMSKLEEMEVYLYEPIFGLCIDNSTKLPLPVSKTLTRLVLSCRYCKAISLNELGKMLPTLQNLEVAAPLEQSTLADHCLEHFTKLEELTIFNGDLVSIAPGAFKSTPALKRLTIKYAHIDQCLNGSHWDGVEESLEHLAIVGTPMESFNVSRFKKLASLDVSQNRLTKFERTMFPSKAKFTELNLSYNPITTVEHGFLSGVEIKTLRINGWRMETIDLAAVVDGIVELQTVDMTQHFKLRSIEIGSELPTTFKRLVLGRSPYLRLDNETMAEMMRQRNMSMIVEGKIACSCGMRWMIDMRTEHPELLEIEQSRAVCSREGTHVEDGTMPEEFWTKPTVVNFLEMMHDEKFCKDGKTTTTTTITTVDHEETTTKADHEEKTTTKADHEEKTTTGDHEMTTTTSKDHEETTTTSKDHEETTTTVEHEETTTSSDITTTTTTATPAERRKRAMPESDTINNSTITNGTTDKCNDTTAVGCTHNTTVDNSTTTTEAPLVKREATNSSMMDEMKNSTTINCTHDCETMANTTTDRKNSTTTDEKTDSPLAKREVGEFHTASTFNSTLNGTLTTNGTDEMMNTTDGGNKTRCVRDSDPTMVNETMLNTTNTFENATTTIADNTTTTVDLEKTTNAPLVKRELDTMDEMDKMNSTTTTPTILTNSTIVLDTTPTTNGTVADGMKKNETCHDC